jgi:KamA family protein
MPNFSNLKPRFDIAYSTPSEFQVYTERQLEKIKPLQKLSEAQRFDMRVVANVLPFRVNQYVIDELIDWDNIPDDPMFQLTFPQRAMLTNEHFGEMAAALRCEDKQRIKQTADEIRQQLNPHPAGQTELNVPQLCGEVMQGMQHKYRETLLFFPSQGQVCHSYCTFCFRWAQFIGDKALRFAAKETEQLHRYLQSHHHISDLLITGGDPMVMKSSHLAAYLEPLMMNQFEHVQTIRIGTKSLSFWPQRYVTDPDADELLRLLELLVAAGKHVALMAHYNHWREMETDIAQEAIRRVRDTGAVIRTQAPLLRHINDDAGVWARMWRNQVRLGMTPYYMFIERDTGARHYFEVPLAQAWSIYREAMQQVSGLARTARGPSMSAGPGKVEVQGITEVAGKQAFVLRFIQARNPDWVQRPFFAKYDPKASWLDQLQPLSGESQFFFEEEYQRMLNQR